MKKQIDEINALDKARAQGEWSFVNHAGQGNGGIRNKAGFICFLSDVSRYEGQEERYEREIKERLAHGNFIAKAPEMVAIINAQAEMLDKMAESLNLLSPHRETDYKGMSILLAEYKAFKEEK